MEVAVNGWLWIEIVEKKAVHGKKWMEMAVNGLKSLKRLYGNGWKLLGMAVNRCKQQKPFLLLGFYDVVK